VLSKEIFTSASTDPQALFDHAVLEKKIQEVIAAAKIEPSAMLEDPEVEMDDTKCRTFVVTTRLRGAGASAVLMRTYGTLHYDPFEAQIWEAARATSAAPTFFLPIKIDGVAYGDGGMGWNNPTHEAINEAHQIWPGRPIGCLVSLGTGLEDAVQLMGSTEHPVGGITGKALHTVSQKLEFRLKVAKYCVDCVTSCERVHEDIARNLLGNGLDGKYFRLNIPQGMAKIQLEEWEKREDIEALAMDYMDSGEVVRVKQAVATILLDSGSSSVTGKSNGTGQGLQA
jgi:Patatin-like phospholipase